MTDSKRSTEQVVVRFFRKKTCYNLQNKKRPVTIDLREMRPITRREDVKEERVLDVDTQWSMDLFATVEFDRVCLGKNTFGYEQLFRVVIKDGNCPLCSEVENNDGICTHVQQFQNLEGTASETALVHVHSVAANGMPYGLRVTRTTESDGLGYLHDD